MRKRLLWGGVLLVVVIAFAGTGITKAALVRMQEQPVAFVDQEAVSQKEFAFFLDQQKASVYDYFKQKYNAGDSSSFWSDSFGGEVPSNRAKQQAMDQLVKAKVQQIQAKKYGILDDTSYDAFLSKLKKENERRSAAVAHGQIIYGPTQYTEQMYYGYNLSNMATQLKQVLAEKSWNISDSDLQNYYNEVKNTSFKNPETVRIQKLGLFFSDGKGRIDEGTKTAALARLEQVVSELKSGKTLDEEIALLNHEASFRIDADEQTFDGKAIRADYQAYGAIKRAADKLDKGQVSDIFEFGGAYYIIQLLEREEHGFKDFDSVKNDVRELYLDTKYEASVTEWIRQAEVKINHKVYDRLKIR